MIVEKEVGHTNESPVHVHLDHFNGRRAAKELAFIVDQLQHEAIVGPNNWPQIVTIVEGGFEIEPTKLHQIGNDNGGRPADARHAMDQHVGVPFGDGLVDLVDGMVEMGQHVRRGIILERYPHGFGLLPKGRISGDINHKVNMVLGEIGARHATDSG